ncbi:MAG: hypothetical protein CSA33_02410 [Desulfobulbus propionicus]|nr:MAG: hypothetical protein CSA33_02410 [Desulfobulbus propionicus]
MPEMVRNRTTTRSGGKKRYRTAVLVCTGLLAGMVLMVDKVLPSWQKHAATIQSFASRIVRNSAGTEPADSVLRGTIYDHKYKELAVSYPVYALFAQPVGVQVNEELIASLAAITGRRKSDLAGLLKSHEPVVRLATYLDARQAEQIKQLGAQGLYCTMEEARFYPANSVGAYVLGFVGGGIGLTGIEGQYDVILRPGCFMAGDIRDFQVQEEILGAGAADIKLSLDLSLQKVLARQLRNYLSAQGLTKGMGILVDPYTGRIFALSNQPTFNPNVFWQADAAVQEDRIYRQKLRKELLRPILARAAAILREGLTYEGMLPEGVSAPEYGVSDAAITSLQKELHLYAPVESSWESGAKDRFQAVRESIRGMNSTLTGIQIQVALASLINGGWRLAPWLLEGMYDHGTSRMYPFNKNRIHRAMVLGPANGVLLRRELFADRGRAKGRKGKRTAKVASEIFTHSEIIYSGQRSEYINQQLYVGMVPPKKPKYFLVIAVEEDQLSPKPLTAIGRNKSLEKVGDTILTKALAADLTSVSDHPGEKARDNMNTFFVSKRLNRQVSDTPRSEPVMEMPLIKGLSLRKAMQRLGRQVAKIRVIGTGTVVEQDPAAGQPLQGVTVCTIRLEPGESYRGQ